MRYIKKSHKLTAQTTSLYVIITWCVHC